MICGDTATALYYEMTDMEQAVKNKTCANKNGIDKNSADKNDTNKNSESNEQNEQDEMHLAYTRDVMEIMTRLRKDWGMKYPGENWD